MTEIKVVGSYQAQWGEGPIWWEGKLYYVDIEKHLILSYDPKTGEEEEWDVGQRVGTVVPRLEGGFLFAGDDGIFELNEEGDYTSIIDPEPEKENNRFNDGKCSPDGRFFAGSISLVKKEGDAFLYSLDVDQQLTKAYGPVTNSNGLAWSKDGKTLYYIDTPRKAVLAFDYDQEGRLSNEREVIKTEHYESSPDGMAIDENDHLWIAFCHGSMVVEFDPASGEELRKIELPCMETTACAFGGDQLQDLYVTTGVHKTEKEENAGRLFVVKGLGVKGQPANAYAG